MSSPKKFGAKPLRVFKGAASWAGVTPWVFVTDGPSDFVGPAKKAFWRNAGCRFAHAAEIHSHNAYNVQESPNGDVKPLLRRRGGFKIMNSPLIALGILCYFRPHGEPGGKTPAEAAGIRLEGDDRILALLELRRHSRLCKTRVESGFSRLDATARSWMKYYTPKSGSPARHIPRRSQNVPEYGLLSKW